MKEHAFRCTKGNDLKKVIEAYCAENEIHACSISTCVGCVYQLRLRLADGKSVRQWNSQFEIVSLTGTIAQGLAHIHIACSDLEAQCVGGHLLDGTLINTTAEIVLIELETMDFMREFDPSTGYDELVIKQK